MDAEFNTEIRFRKIPENITDILEYISGLSRGKSEIYFFLSGPIELPRNNTIELAGPYGLFSHLEDTGIFEKIARLSPDAEWSGEMSGFTSGDEQMLRAELKCNTLHLKSWVRANEYYPERYIEKVREYCPWDTFSEIFSLSDSNDESSFDSFVSDYLINGDIRDIDYYTFSEYFETELDEDEFMNALDKFQDFRFPKYDAFVESFEDDFWDMEWEIEV